MIVPFLLSLCNRLFAWLDVQCQSRFWWLKTALVSTVFVFLFTFPYYHVYLDELLLKEGTPETGAHQVSTAYVVKCQIEAPFQPLPQFGPPSKHQNKRSFRLTMPTLGHAFGLTPFQLVLIENGLGVTLFALLAMLVARTTGDRVCGVLAAVALAFTYPGYASFTDLSPLFDGVAFWCLLAAMFFRKTWVVALFTLAGAWTDERALIASGFVYLWWNVQAGIGERRGLSQFFVPSGQAVAVVGAWVLYFAGRFALSHFRGFQTLTGGVGLPSLRGNWPHVFAGLLSGIEGFWLVIVLGLVGLVLVRNGWLLAAAALGVGIVMAVSISVADMTRSISYLLPLIPLSIAVIRRFEDASTLRWMLLAVAVLNMVSPSYIVWNDSFTTFPPVIPKLLKLLFAAWGA